MREKGLKNYNLMSVGGEKYSFVNMFYSQKWFSTNFLSKIVHREEKRNLTSEPTHCYLGLSIVFVELNLVREESYVVFLSFFSPVLLLLSVL